MPTQEHKFGYKGAIDPTPYFDGTYAHTGEISQVEADKQSLIISILTKLIALYKDTLGIK